jgi:hypothetical protein
MRRVVVLLGVLVALTAPARADDDYRGGTVIFARGASLYRTDPRGKTETEIATLAAKTVVRALRTDAAGSVLLADVGGTWQWMPLDGSTKTLTDLPCADGPAQLAEDAACVLCRGKQGATIIVNLASGATTPIDAPAPGARIAGRGADRKLVWADKNGVWTASPREPKKATKVAPEAPLRGFLPSPDGGRALGVYADSVYTDAHHTKPADVLMNFALDGQGARRKVIKDAVPVEWSHDAQWALVQDGASACILRASGGQYKCWKGYTAVSIAPDGTWALVLANRDGSKKQAPAAKPGDKAKDAKAKDTKAKDDAKKKPAVEEAVGGDEPDAGDGGADTVDVAVPPPSGPLSLMRAELDGPFTNSPALIVKVVDGAAVWVPAKP